MTARRIEGTKFAANMHLADVHLANVHLTEEQFGQLLAGPEAGAAAEAHLSGCEQCAAELAGLRDALGLFREANTAYAESELRRLPRIVPPVRPALEPAYWALAAAMALAAFLPMQQMLRPHAVQPAVASAGAGAADRAAESDEALLDDVNREVTASVPAPMQALSDPTDDAASGGVQAQAQQGSGQTSAKGQD